MLFRTARICALMIMSARMRAVRKTMSNSYILHGFNPVARIR